MKKIIIIGGGAAGLFAALSAVNVAPEATEVIVLEKNEKAGKKIYITGKGRCNLTNDCDPEEFLSHVVANPKFLMSSLNLLTPKDTIVLFKKLGLEVKTERGRRVFPSSDKASDVTAVLMKRILCCGVKVVFESNVLDIEKNNDGFTVKTLRGEFCSDAVIIATGGLSYPSTGSNGAGYVFAEKFGHTIIKPCPSLVSLKISEKLDLEGLSLKNIEVSLLKDGKVLSSEFGEMLFTHDGVSGPCILPISRIVSCGNYGNYILKINLKPALSTEVLDKRILRDFDSHKNKNLSNALENLLPKKLIRDVIIKSEIPPEKKAAEVTKAERGKLAETLQNFTLTVTGTGGFNEAVVTAGGVCVKEVNPKTMESKIVKGLFFAGEVIDIDALTGGYNLQCAFSTGYAAGKAAALS
ncbi:MAG: NAD(P)/FAD-dependent oxidoreductase [Clostridiales bacterium]|jgi:predicted Rossmann fold flavoprotein|nr:NAD(P)/FAD-dependent oxidoreductase [Clostridiales bacterium]